ncbi:MAG: hypothetical protein H7A23_11320 [Leptospiraceae bacterium]|nr:hypothetical protein [Leptospiraceae bacterium]MCP5495135.1 hypothetical protein [Leptospiraceae bacterium]
MRYSLLAILFFVVSCSTSSSAYMKDRKKDLLDIVSFQVGGGFGAGIQISKISLGFGMFIYRTSSKPFLMFLVGQHKARYFNYEYAWSTNLVGYTGKCSAKSKDRTYIDNYINFLEHCESLRGTNEYVWEDFKLRNKSYDEKTAKDRKYLNGKIEITLGWVLGLNVQLNLYELADFFAGLFLIDLLDDDRHYKIAIKSARDKLRYYIERGKKYYEQKKFTLALRDYRIVTRSSNRVLAIKLLKQYQDQNPNNPFYLNSLAEAYYWDKQYTNSKILSLEASKFTKNPRFIEEIEKRNQKIYEKEKGNIQPTK